MITQPYTLRNLSADRVLHRIRALGYVVTVRFERGPGSSRDRLVLQASDSRTGEHHVVRADWADDGDEIRSVSELAELVASDLEG